MFKDVSCEFYIINVQKSSTFISDDMVVVSASATIYQTIVDAAKKSIKNLISKIKKKHNNTKHQFHSIVDYDNFIDSLNQTTKINNIDLIVMGTKGASGLEKVIFGSNTVRVMQRSNTPVLAIPEGCTYKDLNAVAFTSSFQSLYHQGDLKPLINLTKRCHSKLYVLHVSENDETTNNMNKGIDFFNEYFDDVVYEYMYATNNNVYKTIDNYIKDNNIKLLAMVGRKYSFLERFFSTHTVEKLASYIKIPFLVMHEDI